MTFLLMQGNLLIQSEEEIYNLELLFKDEGGANKKITITNPKEGLPAQVARSALKAIVAAEIFVGTNGDSYAFGTESRYVRRTIEDVYTAQS